jgi:tetratricopeptide (TPR) repeat protein
MNRENNGNRFGGLRRRTAGGIGVWVSLCVLLWAASAGAETETTEELLAKAAWEVRVFSFDNGYDLFKKAMAQSTEGSEEWQQAVFGAAMSIQQMTPPDADKMAKAEEFYGLLIQKTPKSKYIPRSMMMMGRIKELRDFFDDKINLEEARGWYQRVVDTWPKDRIAGEATFRIAATYVQTYDEKQVKKGIKILEDWLQKHPDDPMASGMWQYLGDTYFSPLEEYRKSLNCYIKADEIGLLEKGREGPVYWRMAVMAEKFLKDRQNAVKYYTKIITLVPTSGKAYMSQLALAKLGAPVPKLEMFEEMMGSPVPGETIPEADATPPPAEPSEPQSPETKNPQAKEGQK